MKRAGLILLALLCYPLVLAIYCASDVWMWAGYQWRSWRQ